MTEFEFLDAQFNRLNEARELRCHDEKTIPRDKKGNPVKFSEFETAELMIQGCIVDYLKLRGE